MRVRRTCTGAFGRLSLFWVLALAWQGLPAFTGEACATPPGHDPVAVERVIDGDTLALADGRRVRMIGLDAPELGRHDRPDAPYAREAARHLETLVALAGQQVILVAGAEPADRHGRALARVFTQRHGDLAGQLIEQGLAYAVVIAPNTGGTECHFAAERRARTVARGLWSTPGAAVVAATDVVAPGFALVRGTVTEVRRRRHDALVELEGGLVVRILEGGYDHDPRALQGRIIEVRGWVHAWRGAGRAMTVSHPAALSVILADDI